MPGPSPNAVGHDGAKHSVEVEQEEYCEDRGQNDEDEKLTGWRH